MAKVVMSEQFCALAIFTSLFTTLCPYNCSTVHFSPFALSFLLFVVTLYLFYTMLFKLWRGLVGVAARPDLLTAKSMNAGVKKEGEGCF